MSHKVKILTKTCEIFPCQWEGNTWDGNFVYIRFKLGKLQMSVAHTEYSAVAGDKDSSTKIFEFGYPEKDYLSFEQMKELAKDFIDFTYCTFLEDDFRFYIYTIPQEKFAYPEYASALAIESLFPFKLSGKPAVKTKLGDKEVTGDKQKYFVDPDRKVFTYKDMQDYSSPFSLHVLTHEL